MSLLLAAFLAATLSSRVGGGICQLCSLQLRGGGHGEKEIGADPSGAFGAARNACGPGSISVEDVARALQLRFVRAIRSRYSQC